MNDPLLPDARGSSGSEVVRLHARIAELERRNEELHRLSAVVAHELKEPLIAVESYASLLAEHLGRELDNGAMGDLDALQRGATRMRVVVETLLLEARPDASLQRVRVDLANVVEECVAMLRSEIEARGARAVIHAMPSVYGDPALLRSVLQNLIANALRYGSRENGRIGVSASRADSAWRVAVDSEGTPVPAEDRFRIFDPFERGRGERRADGSGLGLAICRTIVERHGGTIGVEPLERGNRFVFTLPD